MTPSKTITLLAAFLVLMLVPTTQAQIINEIKLNISSSGLVRVNEEFKIPVNETSIDFILPVYENLEISSSGIKIPYSNKTIEGGLLVSIDLRTLPSDAHMRDVSMKYETQYMTSKNGSTWSISFATKSTPRATIIKVYFPKNSTIVSILPKEVYFTPVDKDLLWLYPQEDKFNFTCNYEHDGSPVIPVTTEEKSLTTLLLMAVIIALAMIILAFTVYTLRKRASSKIVGKVEIQKDVVVGVENPVESSESRKASDVGGIEFEFKTQSSKPKIKSNVFNVLDEDEKNILSIILERGDDDTTQAFIYKTTKMPKSSLSEIVKRLEKRNVIECRREGRLKWIKLKKWVLE